MFLRGIVRAFPSGTDKIVVYLAGFIQDASPEVRQSARECFFALGREMDRVLVKYLNESLYKMVKELMDKDVKRKTFNRSAEPFRMSNLNSLKSLWA